MRSASCLPVVNVSVMAHRRGDEVNCRLRFAIAIVLQMKTDNSGILSDCNACSVFNVSFFYRAVLNAGRSSREKVVLSVCPSVLLSVKHMDCDETEENSGWIFIPYETTYSLVFGEEEWLMGQAAPV